MKLLQKKGKFLLFTLFSFLFLQINSEDFVAYGGRSSGMGWAGVASTRGAKNIYWNPARLAMDRKIDFSFSPINLNVTALGSIVSLVDEFNDLPDFDTLQNSYQNGFDPRNPTHVENARLAFKLLFDDVIDFGGDDGIIINNTSGFGLHFNVGKNAFGLSGAMSATIGISALINVDYSKISLSNDNGVTNALDELFPNPIHTFGDISEGNRNAAIKIADQLLLDDVVSSTTDISSLQEMLYQADQAGVDLNDPLVEDAVTKVITTTQPVNAGAPGSGQTFEEALKDSGFWVKGLLLQSATISYARPFYDIFSIGANINLFKGRTFKRFVTLDDLDTYEIPKSYSDLNKEDYEDTYNFGIDLGLNYEPISGLSFGVIGKNLNTPTFKFRDGSDYHLYPQARFGVSYSKDFKVGTFMIAGDIDILENRTDAFDDIRFRQVALGAEVNLLKFLFLRAGYNNNLSIANGKGGLYTAGIGFYVFGISLDISAGMGDDVVKIDGTPYPTRGGIAIELQWNRNF